MANNKPTKIVSKKHLARQERERRQTRIIAGVAIGVVATVVLLIAYGLLNNTLFLNIRPAVTVNGESLTLQEFQVRVRVNRQQLVNQYMQYMQYIQLYQSLGMDLSSDSQVTQALTQITGQLDDASLIGSQTLDNMIDDLIIRQYAEANGITVTTADIEEAIHSAVGYYPNGTPTPTLTPTKLVYSTLNPTQLVLITPTLTSTLAPTLTPFQTWTPNLTSTATPIPSLTPTATPITSQGFDDLYQKGLQNYAKLGMSEAEFRKIFYEFNLYRERVKAKVTADVKHEQDQVWVRQILVADGTIATTIRAQLMAGADFTNLAAQSSLDTATKDKGGDLGWLSLDQIKSGTDLGTAAFSLPIGEISQPIQTVYGYYIIQVLGHEVRPLTDQQYQDAVTAAFNTWLQDQRKNAKIVTNSSWTNVVPTSPTIAEAQAADAATQTAYVSTQAGITTTP